MFLLGKERGLRAWEPFRGSVCLSFFLLLVRKKVTDRQRASGPGLEGLGQPQLTPLLLALLLPLHHLKVKTRKKKVTKGQGDVDVMAP